MVAHGSLEHGNCTRVRVGYRLPQGGEGNWAGSKVKHSSGGLFRAGSSTRKGREESESVSVGE